MPIFDQRNQTVGNQWNIVGDVHFENISNQADGVQALEKLQGALAQAIQQHQLDQEPATDAQHYMTKGGLLKLRHWKDSLRPAGRRLDFYVICHWK